MLKGIFYVLVHSTARDVRPHVVSAFAVCLNSGKRPESKFREFEYNGISCTDISGPSTGTALFQNKINLSK